MTGRGIEGANLNVLAIPLNANSNGSGNTADMISGMIARKNSERV